MNRKLKIVLIAFGCVIGGLFLIGLIGSIVAPIEEDDDDPKAKPAPAETSASPSPSKAPEKTESPEESDDAKDDETPEAKPKPKPTAPPGSITKAGKDLSPWPFTVDSGVLACKNDAVTFTTGGTTYALNGTAKSRGAKDLEPIWAEDEKAKAEWEEAGVDWEESGMTVPKVSVGPAIDKGLKLCE